MPFDALFLSAVTAELQAAVGARIDFQDMHFSVLQADDRRVERVRLRLTAPQTP